MSDINREFHLGSQFAKHVEEIDKTLWFYAKVLSKDQSLILLRIREQLAALANQQINKLLDIRRPSDNIVENYIRFIITQLNWRHP